MSPRWLGSKAPQCLYLQDEGQQVMGKVAGFHIQPQGFLWGAVGYVVGYVGVNHVPCSPGPQ